MEVVFNCETEEGRKLDPTMFLLQVMFRNAIIFPQ